jgi:hypothetical protein
MGNKRIPLEVWASIKALYESGQFNSVKELQSNCKKTFVACPSVSSIEKRAIAEAWDKEAQKEAIEEKKAENYKDLFAELGLTEKKTAQVIVDGVLCAENMKTKILGIFKKDGAEILGDPEKTEAMIDLIGSLFQNMTVAHKYLETKLKLSGDNPTEKRKITVKDDGSNGSSRVRDYTAMSDDEIDYELKKLTKLEEGLEKKRHETKK